MAETLETLSAHPLVWGIVALLLGAVVYALLKRLVKIALILALGILALFLFFELTGTEPPKRLEEARDGVQERVADGARRGTEAATQGVRELGGKLRDAAGRAAREALEGDRLETATDPSGTPEP